LFCFYKQFCFLFFNLFLYEEQRTTTSLPFVVHFHIALGDMAPENPTLLSRRWPALVHLVTWRCLAVVVVGVGDGCGWQSQRAVVVMSMVGGGKRRVAVFDCQINICLYK
jgi:hypothetical protein